MDVHTRSTNSRSVCVAWKTAAWELASSYHDRPRHSAQSLLARLKGLPPQELQRAAAQDPMAVSVDFLFYLGDLERKSAKRVRCLRLMDTEVSHGP